MQFHDPGAPQQEKVSDTFFFGWRGDREDLFPPTFCQQELVTRAETYYIKNHISHSQDWQMEGLSLQPKEVLDTEGNPLCPGASCASVRGQIPRHKHRHCCQYAASTRRVVFKGKASRKCDLQKTPPTQPLLPVQKAEEETVLWLAYCTSP